MKYCSTTLSLNQLVRKAWLSILWGLLATCLTQAALAQNCKKLTPAGTGLDDAPQINDCMQRKGFAKLKGGTFLLYTPIVFPRNTPENPVSGVRLIGKGMDATKLVIQSDCVNHFPFVSEQSPNYQSAIQVIRSPQAGVSGFELDLTNLRQDCNHTSNYMVAVNRSPNTQVTGVRIKGSSFGDGANYTTGGANSGGILVVNSEATIISDNELKDIAFTVENGSQSAGQGGISVASSANAIVQNNRLEHIAFALIVSNGAAREGYTGDSSGTSVIGNTITGAATIGCPNCSGGRALKLQACGAGDEPPLDRLTVTNNNATDFGGGNGLQAGSGLDLVCGVTNSTFDNNLFIGAATAEFGLQIRSSFLSVPNTSHHNKFQRNVFLSGKGKIGCNDQCADVNFTQDGPDQVGLQRNGQDRAGNNTASSFRYATDRGCGEYAHAFFLYLDGKSFVRNGDNILLAASGVRPNATVTFTFRSVEDNRLVASYMSVNANRNCVMNQEYMLIDNIKFPAGEYKVFAEYQDGNSNATIRNDALGTLLVKIAK